jgi:TRAP-type uncharacterized transport system substrate-binding protein
MSCQFTGKCCQAPHDRLATILLKPIFGSLPKPPMKHPRMTLALLLACLFLPTSCDFISPKRTFRLAVPKSDYYYNLIATHLQPVLNSNGYRVDVVEAANGIEASRLVSRGEADLALSFSHSIIMANELGPDAANLRTVFPLVSSVLFAFSKTPVTDSTTAKGLFEGKRVGLELLNGETQASLNRMMVLSEIKGYTFVRMEDNPDVMVYWGTYYGKRTKKYLEEGWYPYSFRDNWLKFQTLNEPALTQIQIPSVPGNAKSIALNTLTSQVLLITNGSIGENAIYQLTSMLMKEKLELVHTDMMYRTISEKFDSESLLYPLHEGTNAYLRRDQPTFLERYADAIALVLSFMAVLYGAFQAISAKLARLKKEQLDLYFLDFMDIRSKATIDREQQIEELDGLFHRAVKQMTNERLEKADFHILSRLIQQEIANLRAKK